jgi:hypothetical protein
MSTGTADRRFPRSNPHPWVGEFPLPLRVPGITGHNLIGPMMEKALALTLERLRELSFAAASTGEDAKEVKPSRRRKLTRARKP